MKKPLLLAMALLAMALFAVSCESPADSPMEPESPLAASLVQGTCQAPSACGSPFTVPIVVPALGPLSSFGSATAQLTLAGVVVDIVPPSNLQLTEVAVWVGNASQTPPVQGSAIDLSQFQVFLNLSPSRSSYRVLVPESALTGVSLSPANLSVSVFARQVLPDANGNPIATYETWALGTPIADGYYFKLIGNCPVILPPPVCDFVYPAIPGEECATLQVNVSGASGPFSYQWDQGLSGGSSVQVCPPVGFHQYKVTVSNANGFVCEQSFRIRSVDVSCGTGNAEKIEVCSIPPGSTSGTTLCVPSARLKQLLGPDHPQNYLGACGEAIPCP